MPPSPRRGRRPRHPRRAPRRLPAIADPGAGRGPPAANGPPRCRTPYPPHQTCVLAGAAPAVLDLRAGFRPDAFAAATAALGPGRRYTSLVPTQLLRILDDAAAVVALRSYAAVLVGGAALDPATRERALDAGARVV